MTSLRASIATLQKFSPKEALNISDVYRFLFMKRPVSLNALVAKIAALPETVTFNANIVTGNPLGGAVTLTLDRDGSFRFSGFMRASGALSFSFRIGVVVRSESSQVAVATQETGEVFGTDTLGKRQHNFDRVGSNPKETILVRNLWPGLSSGTMVVTQSSELAGSLGTAIDLATDAIKFLVVAQTLGAPLAICLVLGAEFGDADIDVPGLGGVIGLGIVGGSLFIWGPLAIGPAFVHGVAVGAVVDQFVKIRKLRQEEINFADKVFAGKLDFDRIRLTNLSGLDTKEFVFPTVDNTILVNIGNSFDSPLTAVFPGKPVPGQLLIHELTHAWQIQHFPFAYVPGWLCEGIREQVFIGRAAYDYGGPGPPWDSFHIEAQAHIVDDWFGGTGQQAPKDSLDTTVSPQMSPNSPYFGYIEHNIRAGSA